MAISNNGNSKAVGVKLPPFFDDPWSDRWRNGSYNGSHGYVPDLPAPEPAPPQKQPPKKNPQPKEPQPPASGPKGSRHFSADGISPIWEWEEMGNFDSYIPPRPTLGSVKPMVTGPEGEDKPKPDKNPPPEQPPEERPGYVDANKMPLSRFKSLLHVK